MQPSVVVVAALLGQAAAFSPAAARRPLTLTHAKQQQQQQQQQHYCHHQQLHLSPVVQPQQLRVPLDAVRMQDPGFWENVLRFMRFGITSVTGLVAGLLSPFSVFLRTPTLTAIGATLFAGILAFVYISLSEMTSPSGAAVPSYQAPAPSRTALGSSQSRGGQNENDPSMKKMLLEIYGE